MAKYFEGMGAKAKVVALAPLFQLKRVSLSALHIHEKFIFSITTLAAFLLIFRGSGPVKIADLLFVILGLALVFYPETQKSLLRFLKAQSRYVRIALLLFLFIIVGQAVSYFFYGTLVNQKVVLNYARVVFNYGLFFLLAYLISQRPRLLTSLSLAIFISPITILFYEIFIEDSESFSLLSGGRLKGFFENPILLGMWLGVIFLIGLGFFLQTKRWWARTSILIWLSLIANFIFWSASRSVWLALGLSLFGWAFFYFYTQQRQKLKLFLTATLFAFTVGYLTLPNTETHKLQPWVQERAVTFIKNPAQGQIRTSLWLGAAPLALQNPLGFGLFNSTGLGPSYQLVIDGREITTNTPSNTFLEIMLYGGLGALIVFLMLLLEFAKEARIIFRKPFTISDLEAAWLFAAPLVLVSVFFNDGFLLRLVWFVFGVTLGVLLLHKKEDLITEPVSSSL